MQRLGGVSEEGGLGGVGRDGQTLIVYWANRMCGPKIRPRVQLLSLSL